MRVFLKSQYYCLVVLTVCITLTTSASFGQTVGFPPELYSRAERTNYEETSHYADVMNFVYTLQKYGKLAHVEIYGKTYNGLELPLVVIADPPVKTPAEAVRSGKPVVYIQGNIHAGEVEGKEATMELMREIALGARRFLLSDQIILFGPIFNAEGNDNFGENRGSQEGSPRLTGTRATSLGYNLNRDGTKIDAPETQGLMENVILKWDPILLVDLHTTNGSWHGYGLTYAPSYQTAGHPGTSDYTMDIMLPSIREKVYERSGIRMYLYGGFRGWPPTEWRTYSHQPRYITNSMGLRNRLGILSETFAHDKFEKRILSAKMFTLSILEYTNEHGKEIVEVIKKAEEETVQQILDNAGNFQRGVQFRVAPLDEPFELLAYESEQFTDNEGRQRTRRTGKIVYVPDVKNFNRYEPTKLSTVPRGYVFPAELQNVADKLKEHGIEVTTLDQSTSFEGEEFIITSFSIAQRRYENHNTASIEGSFKSSVKELPEGSFLVDLAQPLAYLAFYLLEPESDDGLAYWNFFDDYLIKRNAENTLVPYPVFKYVKIVK